MTLAKQNVFVLVPRAWDRNRIEGKRDMAGGAKKFKKKAKPRKVTKGAKVKAKKAGKKPIEAKKAKKAKKAKEVKSVAKPTAVILEGPLEMPIFGVEVLK